MFKLKKIWKELSLRNDRINTLVSIVFIISLILVFIYKNNHYVILAACTTGGLMNVMNGLKLWKDPTKKMVAMTYLMMGCIIIVMGVVVVRIIQTA